MSFFNPAEIRLPCGFRLRVFDTLDSTNDEAKRAAEKGEKSGLIILAKEQTSGRGRRGRQWVSPLGNLYFSILLTPDLPVDQTLQLCFVSAVALADSVAYHLPVGTEVNCKWPNDILVEGKKIAGILLESGEIKEFHPKWVVIGVGLNIDHFPDNTSFPATSMVKEGGQNITIALMLESFLNRFQGYLVMWRKLGFAAVRRTWMRRAYGLEQAISVHLPRETLEGIFYCIDNEGALMLRQQNGMRRVTAGDVFYNSRKE